MEIPNRITSKKYRCQNGALLLLDAVRFFSTMPFLARINTGISVTRIKNTSARPEYTSARRLIDTGRAVRPTKVKKPLDDPRILHIKSPSSGPATNEIAARRPYSSKYNNTILPLPAPRDSITEMLDLSVVTISCETM